MDMQIEDIVEMEEKIFGTISNFRNQVIKTFYTTIVFKLNKHKFRLYIYQDNNSWHPFRISHSESKKCPFCEENVTVLATECFILKKNVNIIFNQVMNHPKIRLKLLFL